MWYYQNKQIISILDIPEGAFGFIYKITNNTTGQFYIGKKQILHTTNVKMGKKEKAKLSETITGKGRRPSKKQVVKESNWINYFGSSKKLLEDVKKLGEEAFDREIICFCKSKKSLSFNELKHQILNGCLEKTESYNDNVMGKYFREDV